MFMKRHENAGWEWKYAGGFGQIGRKWKTGGSGDKGVERMKLRGVS